MFDFRLLTPTHQSVYITGDNLDDSLIREPDPKNADSWLKGFVITSLWLETYANEDTA